MGTLASESVKARLWLRLSSLPRHSHATLGSPSSSYRTTRQTLWLSHSAAIDPLSTRKGSVCRCLYPSCPIRLQGAAAECSPCDFSCAKLARSGIAARASPWLSSKIFSEKRCSCLTFFSKPVKDENILGYPLSSMPDDFTPLFARKNSREHPDAPSQ